MKIPWKVIGVALLNAFGLGCQSRPSFSDADVNAAVLGQGLPSGFLLGTATAAHQVEGGNNNDWTDWEPGTYPDGSPHIADRNPSGQADDSWDLFAQDLQAMQHLGVNAYRFSIEWSRIQPNPGPGGFDDAALNRYVQWVQALRAAGIEPMVTLYHFTLPKWVAADGGWQNDVTIDRFEAFVQHVVPALAPSVDYWCTVNEPNVLAIQAYLKGQWPPGLTSQQVSAQVLSRLLQAHARAAKQIRALDTVDADGDGKPALIGIAHHVRVFQPASSSALDNLVAGLTDDFFNESVMKAVQTGRVQLSVPGSVNIDIAVDGLKGSIDYVGLNYYTRDHVRADLSDPSLSKQYTPSDVPQNDLGWEIYPEGLYLFIKRYAPLGLPIIITENGIPDRSGQVRPHFIRQHFYALQKAVQEGANVRGYFHWSLIDNYEWDEGYSAKFGLYRVDLPGPPFTRVPTDAVSTYQDIARNLGLIPQ